MKRLFFGVLLIILLLIGFCVWIIDRKSTAYLSHLLSTGLNTKVTLASTSLGPRQLVIEGLRVADPTAKDKPALEIDRISIDYQFLTLFNQTVMINDITIDQPTVYVRLYNVDGSDNNWATLIKGMNSGPAGSYNETESQQMIVDELVIYDLKGVLESSLLGGHPAPLPIRKKIVIDNINSNNAKRTKEQLQIIIEAIMEVMSQHAGLGNILNNIGSIAKMPSDLVSSIIKQVNAQKHEENFSKPETFLENLQNDITDGADNMKRFFNDLFTRGT